MYFERIADSVWSICTRSNSIAQLLQNLRHLAALRTTAVSRRTLPARPAPFPSPRFFELRKLLTSKSGHRNLEQGEEGVLGQATHVDVPLHQDVAVHTPRSPPRVADYPVVGAVGPAVSHQDDAVIDCPALAGVVVEDPGAEIAKTESKSRGNE